MLEGFVADAKICGRLLKIDEEIAAGVKAKGCVRCGGRLDRADYERKPREGVFVTRMEGFSRRISLCCSRDGCRARNTPPSVRFLGRRVYLAVTVVAAVIVTNLLARAAIIRRASGVPTRTVRRWATWFRADLVATAMFAVAGARFSPSLDCERLPMSLFERFVGDDSERMVLTLRWLLPWS